MTVTRPRGTLFLIVGPSGVGKDSLIDGLRGRLEADRFEFARRVITRPADAGGEAHEACSTDQFLSREAAGEFLITWRAHGLAYGLRTSIRDCLDQGRHVIANGSRSTAAELSQRVEDLVVIEITAPPEVLAERLAGRARETPEQIANRLNRTPPPYPPTVRIIRIVNDSRLDIGWRRLEAGIRSHVGKREGGQIDIVSRKISGDRLDVNDIDRALSLIVARSMPETDRDAFLIACANDLDQNELVQLARWRARLMPRVKWDAPRVVDKHSLGGTAGSRVTMVVIPIVAAHGMIIPKTSSRAITSASGTADAMAVLANVELNPAELRQCVTRARGCIAWNGRLNHSALDEAMHAIERPMRLDTRRWSAASILSKKYSAGATHIVIDIPYAPEGKVADRESAQALATLFESLGQALGLTVRAFPTDGSAPIGRGIGPALEARDVLEVLRGDASAPGDLREKSLFFASQIIALDPAMGRQLDRAASRARALLDSGAALAAMNAIIDAQGRRPWPDESDVKYIDVNASTAGQITRVRAQTISQIARTAGAPADVLAGVDLNARPGDRVAPGTRLFRIQGCDREALKRAAELAALDTGFDLSPA
jgi:thymidine phosphorylase